MLAAPHIQITKGAGYYTSLLHMAIGKLKLKLVDELISKGVDVNVRDSNTGDHPLHLLINVFSKDPQTSNQIMSLLVKSGADMNSKNNDLWTPLHLAVKRGSYDAVEALLSIK